VRVADAQLFIKTGDNEYCENPNCCNAQKCESNAKTTNSINEISGREKSIEYDDDRYGHKEY